MNRWVKYIVIGIGVILLVGVLVIVVSMAIGKVKEIFWGPSVDSSVVDTSRKPGDSPPPSPESKISPVPDIVGKIVDTDISKVSETRFILDKDGKTLALSVGPAGLPPPPPPPPAVPPPSSGLSSRAHVARSYASAFWGADWKDMFPEAQEEMNKLNTRVQGVETRVGNIEVTATDLQDRVKNLENTTLPALEKRLGDQIVQSRTDIKSDLDSRDKAMANALGSIADTLKQVSGKLDTQSQKIEDRMSRGDTAVANLKGQLDVLLKQNTAPAPQPNSPQGPPASSP